MPDIAVRSWNAATLWLGAGWRLFMAAPGTWILMLLTFLLVNLVLALVPVIGPLASNLISPGLTAGLLWAAHELHQGHSTRVGHLFTPLRDARRRGPLLLLGLIGLVAGVLIALVFAGTLSALVAALQGEADAAAIGGASLIGVLLLTLVLTALAMAMVYAVPLVCFAGVTPVAALQSSFTACLKNWAPLLWLGLIIIALAIVAAIPMGLGFLVLIPVLMATLYASFDDIYSGWRGAAAIDDPQEPVAAPEQRS